MYHMKPNDVLSDPYVHVLSYKSLHMDTVVELCSKVIMYIDKALVEITITLTYYYYRKITN